jgi:Retrotransposon gag protein
VQQQRAVRLRNWLMNHVLMNSCLTQLLVMLTCSPPLILMLLLMTAAAALTAATLMHRCSLLAAVTMPALPGLQMPSEAALARPQNTAQPALPKLSLSAPQFSGKNKLPSTYKPACEDWLMLSRVTGQNAVNVLGLQTLTEKAREWFYTTRELDPFASVQDYFVRLPDHFGYRNEEEYANKQWEHLRQGDRTVQQYIMDFNALALRVPGLSVADRQRKFRYSLSEPIQAKLQEDSATKRLDLRGLQDLAIEKQEALKLSGVVTSTSGGSAGGRQKFKGRRGGNSGGNASSSPADPPRQQQQQQQASGPSFLQRPQTATAVTAVQSQQPAITRTFSPPVLMRYSQHAICYGPHAFSILCCQIRVFLLSVPRGPVSFLKINRGVLRAVKFAVKRASRQSGGASNLQRSGHPHRVAAASRRARLTHAGTCRRLISARQLTVHCSV